MQIEEEISQQASSWRSSSQPLNFTKIQQELIQITEEIRKQHELSLVDRLRDIFFQEESLEPQLEKH